MLIDKTSIIGNNVKIGKNTKIGPFCYIDGDVIIGDDVVIDSHVVIAGNTIIGDKNRIYPFATIGKEPQDLKFRGEKSKVIIGNNNTIREHVTIHLGTQDGIMETRIGDNCLLMVNVHIAHDCIIGNNVIIANNVAVAGHVIVGDHAVIGGNSAIHQFVHIGKYAMIGGMSGVESDIVPYGLVSGDRSRLNGLNLVGMKRANIDKKEILALRDIFDELFKEAKDGASIMERIKNVEGKFSGNKLAMDVVRFLLNEERKRAICLPSN